MYQNFILSLFFFWVSPFFAQDTIYFDQDHQKVENLRLAESYSVSGSYNKNKAKMVRRTYDKNGQITHEAFFSNKKMTKMQGNSKYWSKGNLKLEIQYKKGKKDGFLKSYWENGTLKRNDFFNNGEFVRGTCFDRNGNETSYYKFKIPPKFPGGKLAMNRFIRTNFKLANDFAKSGLKKVTVQFFVEKNGSITIEKVPEGISLELRLEAIRVIGQMPRWDPGMLDGAPARVQYTLPIIIR